MQNNGNWLDKLAALKGMMPDEPETATEEVAEAPANEKDTQSGRLDIVFERKGRAGKCATIVTGFTLDDDAIAEIASGLKRTLGTGGSARGGEILIQGDRRKDVLNYLISKGFKARII